MIIITLEFTPEETRALSFALKHLDYETLARIFRPRRSLQATSPAADQQAAWRALRRLATALPVA